MRSMTLFTLALLPAVSAALGAQDLSLRVVDGDGAALGLTSVLIRPVAASGAAPIQRLTSSAGTLRQPLAAGSYRVVARRVGYRADSVLVRSDSLTGAVVLRLVRIPQMLLTMVVRETQDCSLQESGNGADGSALWEEVLKGIEARQLLARSYRFERRTQRVITQDPSLGSKSVRTRDTVEVNDPRKRDSSRYTYRAGGYTARSGNTTNIRVFDEADLTRDSFLQFHCHGAPWRDTTDGSVRIAFAPRRNLRESENENLVRGTVIIDAAALLMREVRYEYVRRNKPVGQGTVTYAPATIDGSVIALPARVTGELRLGGGFLGLRSQLASWTIDQSFAGFERVGEQVVP